MKLHAPFIITPRLLPGLKLGDSYLSLEGTDVVEENRDRATFYLDHSDETFKIEDLRSGGGGFRSSVEPFESLLGFMGTAGETRMWEHRTGRWSDNHDLFPEVLMQWCEDHHMEIQEAWSCLQNEEGETLHDLIED